MSTFCERVFLEQSFYIVDLLQNQCKLLKNNVVEAFIELILHQYLTTEILNYVFFLYLPCYNICRMMLCAH